MDHHEKMRLRAAAFRVTRLYPGPVGEVLSRELLTWEEFGYRLGGSQLVMRRFGVPATARASFYVYNSNDEVDALVEALGKAESVFA